MLQISVIIRNSSSTRITETSDLDIYLPPILTVLEYERGKLQNVLNEL